jgi:hypothetical protein
MCRAASTTGEVDHCCLRNVSFVSMHEERGQLLRCSEHKANFRTAVDRHARTWQVCGILDCRQGKRDRGSGYACWVSCNGARGLVLIVQRPQSVEPAVCEWLGSSCRCQGKSGYIRRDCKACEKTFSLGKYVCVGDKVHAETAHWTLLQTTSRSCIGFSRRVGIRRCSYEILIYLHSTVHGTVLVGHLAKPFQVRHS